MRVFTGARATAWSVVCLGVALALSACGVGSQFACTAIGGDNYVAVSLPSTVRNELDSLSVELCRAKRCASLTFRSTPPDSRFAYIQKGVNLRAPDTYLIELDALGEGWKPNKLTRITIRGTSKAGTVIVRRTDVFRFAETYPNGKECDKTPFLSHRTQVDEADRIG